MKFVCSRCNYRFESTRVNDCPYCGDGGCVEKEKSASELIQDVEEILNN